MYVCLEEVQQPSTWGGNISDSRRYEEEKNIMILLSFRTAPSTFLQRENILMWPSKTAASILCFTYGCIFCDPLDCSDHRAAGAHPSSCIFHEKQLSMLSLSPSTSWANSYQKEKDRQPILHTKVLNFSLSKDTFKRVERKARVGKHICITYN